MSIEPTKAEPFAAPVVESLSVRLLVDSFYDPLSRMYRTR
jgi:hypothetical protein